MGRPKGSKNIKTSLFEAELIAKDLGINPFEVLLRMAAGDWKGLGYDTEVQVCEKENGATFLRYTITPEMRMNASAQACRYLFSSKQAVDVRVPEGIEIVVKDYTRK